MRPTSAALVLLLAAPTLGSPQSLGEIAKREQEKQEKKKKSGKPPATVKVYTDEDLKKARESEAGSLTILPDTGSVESSPSSPADQGSAAREAGRAGGDSAGGGPRDERYWRAQAAERRNAVRVAESRVQMLEGQVAALRNDMSPTNLQDPNRLQNQERELREAQDNLEAARRELDAARQALANLEDEARRAGALPGWVR